MSEVAEGLPAYLCMADVGGGKVMGLVLVARNEDEATGAFVNQLRQHPDARLNSLQVTLQTHFTALASPEQAA